MCTYEFIWISGPNQKPEDRDRVLKQTAAAKENLRRIAAKAKQWKMCIVVAGVIDRLERNEAICYDRHFIVVGGLPPGIEENYAYEYDKDFKFIRKHTIQSGYTLMGIQTAAYSGGYWWFGCYGKPEILLKTDASFRLVGKYEFNGSLGIVGRADGRFLIARGRFLPGKGHTASVVVAQADPQKGLVTRQSGLTPPRPTE